MRIKRRLKNDKFAGSIVIGVVFLVTISVSLSAIVLTYAEEVTNESVTGGLKEPNIVGIATSDGTLQFVASESDPEGEFVVKHPDGGLAVVAPEAIDTTSSDIAAGALINIKYLAEKAFGDTVKSGEYTVTYRNTFTKRIIGRYNFDLTFVLNNPPNEPSNPNPANDATEISINADLSWTGGDPDVGDVVTYDVYFAEGDPNPSALVSADQSGTSYDPGTLLHEYDATYYWKIVSSDNDGEKTEGPSWKFTTEAEPEDDYPPYEPSNPNPSDMSNGEAHISTDLSWTGGDPDPGDTVTYDVYFEGVRVSEGQSATTYDLPEDLIEGVWYLWQIVATDSNGESTTGPLWSFCPTSNQPPYEPSNPNPANDATEISINADLRWISGDPDDGDTVTYDIYFGTDSTVDPLVDNHSATTYDPGDLAYSTQYYWKIVAWDNHGASTEGLTWSFTTEREPDQQLPYVPSNPGPTDGASDVSIFSPTFSWDGGSPYLDDTITYDVYFGTTSRPPLVSSGQESTSYSPGITIGFSTTYYWKIVSWNNHGASVEGPMWSFITESDDSPPDWG